MWVAEALPRLDALAARPAVARLAAAFAHAGHELALVGGPVRDALLGRPVTDLDFTTDARPDRILEIVGPVASMHWEIGRAFGTIAARVAGETVEITTYRQDRYVPSSRKPEVEFGDDLDGDLKRRDFTVNAIAVRLPGLALVDPAGGIAALGERRLTTPSPAVESFDDDPLRMLRAARFTAQLGFELDDEGRDAMAALATQWGRPPPASRSCPRSASATSSSSCSRATPPGRGSSCSSTRGSPRSSCPSCPPCGSPPTGRTRTQTASRT